MPKKRKFGSVDDKCRLCLCDDGCMSDIFAEHLRSKIDDFGKSTAVYIENDETLPRNICHVCLYKLDMWIDFKAQFIRSNDALRKHLLLGEVLDNGAHIAKRKRSELQECAEEMDSNVQSHVKKLKSEPPEPTSKDNKDSSLETEKPGESMDVSATTEDLPKNKPESVKPIDISQDSELTTDVNHATSAVSPKVKQIVGRRAKTTERRMESTKRWVARKRALLAATGENETDTDSMGSDDDQLSPVQKARAKCNAEKVAETQRRMTTRALNKLNEKSSACYVAKTDSDTEIIQISDRSIVNDDKNVEPTKLESEISKNATNDESPSSKNVASTSTLSPGSNEKNAIATNSKDDGDNDVVPKSVRSELFVDGATFVVTSTLVLSEPQYINSAMTVDPSLLPNDDNNQERNTDIIDAVQLRRVNPVNSSLKTERKMIDTCLNIEVEGTELEALQRVQMELANFVENDMKNFAINDETTILKNVEPAKNAFQILDRQLKTIVEKTIRKNVENTRMLENRGNNTFTGDFLKAAMRSKIFQPRVFLVRYEPVVIEDNERDSVERRTNDFPKIDKNLLKRTNRELETSLPLPLGKRRSVQPAKYADYNTASPFGSDPNDSSIEDDHEKITNKTKTHRSTLTRSSTTTTTTIVDNRKNQKSLLLTQKSTMIKKSNDEIGKNAVATTNDRGSSEKHICGACGDSFDTRSEVEMHFKNHIKPVKQKMMRCKRCHAVVEARHVQLHVCGVTKNLNNRRIGDTTIGNDRTVDANDRNHKINEDDDNVTNDVATKMEIAKNVRPIGETSKEKIIVQTTTKTRESYTCFVCDAVFTDEEILKDHLQKHCDDMSEDERRNAKDYQCAICSESFASEDVLENHVEKHLFDDEDDNPNLISIVGIDGEKNSMKSEMIHSCGQCSENFDSEMLLMLHMQAHEEEIAIAEWERRGIDNTHEEQHVCVICDDVFATEDELSEHLDVHNGNAHVCLLCDKPFITLEELQRHVNTH